MHKNHVHSQIASS